MRLQFVKKRRSGARVWLRGLLVACSLGAGVGTGAHALTTDELLETLQRKAFDFFWYEANPSNGLIKDRSTDTSPCSIASLGFGLSAICIGIDHGWITREQGRTRVLAALQHLWTSPQGPGASGIIGYKGLYYHFLDMPTGMRTWDCELSTIDTALLFAGIIDAKQYFSNSEPEEILVRGLADSIYYRADWEFMRNSGPGIRMGWRPPFGFSGFGNWIGYNEAMIMYILAIGSPTHPVPASVWNYWTSGYQYSVQYGYTYVIFPPLFGHQYSHCWIDFRNTQDAYMRTKGISYFENSRRATFAQRAYCIANPLGHSGYGENVWGITACDDPFGYAAHGAPPVQNDNGTLAPTAVAGSIAFVPGVVIPALHHLYDTYPTLWGTYGFKDAFNLDFSWWGSDYIGIDQGPIIVMIENYRTGAVWNRFMANPDVQRGMTLAGFLPNPTDAGPGGEPQTTALGQNAPNPARDAATISFRLGTPGHVSLVLYDVSGRVVRTLVDSVRPRGEHVVRLETAGIPSGVYYYRLAAEGSSLVKRCIITK